MLNRSALMCLSLIGLSALGCSKETTSSKNIRTGGIAALIDVYADTDTRHRARRARGGGSDSNTYVDLEGADELVATVDGEAKTLTVVDTGIYEAKFSGVGEDTEFSVTLDRGEDETASDNSGTLPAPFTLDDPADDLSREEDELEVTWSPDSGEKEAARVEGDCIFGTTKTCPTRAATPSRPVRSTRPAVDEPEGATRSQGRPHSRGSATPSAIPRAVPPAPASQVSFISKP